MAMTRAGSAAVTAPLPRGRRPWWRSAGPRPGPGCAGSPGSWRHWRTSPAGRDPLVAARADHEGIRRRDRRTGASSRVRIATPSTRSCDSTSTRRPAFAPVDHSTSPKANQPAAKLPRPEAVKARSRSTSMTAPVPLKAGASRFTPQRASPSAASQLAWNVRPTVWPRTWASDRTSATKASRPRRIWPMAPRRRSTRCAGAAQFTRQTSTSALSHRPSRMSVSVIRSEDSTPCASCASTDRSEPDRTSEAVSPLSGSNSVRRS
jgi:hypothetical protein